MHLYNYREMTREHSRSNLQETSLIGSLASQLYFSAYAHARVKVGTYIKDTAVVNKPIQVKVVIVNTCTYRLDTTRKYI